MQHRIDARLVGEETDRGRMLPSIASYRLQYVLEDIRLGFPLCIRTGIRLGLCNDSGVRR